MESASCLAFSRFSCSIAAYQALPPIRRRSAPGVHDQGSIAGVLSPLSGGLYACPSDPSRQSSAFVFPPNVVLSWACKQVIHSLPALPEPCRLLEIWGLLRCSKDGVLRRQVWRQPPHHHHGVHGRMPDRKLCCYISLTHPVRLTFFPIYRLLNLSTSPASLCPRVLSP